LYGRKESLMSYTEGRSLYSLYYADCIIIVMRRIKQMNPYQTCVFTIRNKADLDEATAKGGEYSLTEKRRWTRAEKELRKARQAGQEYIVLFADAAFDTEMVSYVGLVDSIDVSDQTTVVFSQIKRLENVIRKADLVKLSGDHIHEKFIRPYSLCETPDLVGASFRETLGHKSRIITSEQYKVGLQKSGVTANAKYRDILCAQYAALGGKITATQLAQLLGERRWSVINLRYGEIGHKISDEIGVRPPLGSDKKFWWWNILSDGEPTAQGFVWSLWPELVEALEELGVVDLAETLFPEEIGIKVSEGSKSQVIVNRYERSATARRHCIAYHGTQCTVCGFDFGAKYGQIGEGFIHVHHLVELSSVGSESEVDPVEDLRPVCPNCHSMLHRKNPAYSIIGLQQIMRSKLTGNER